MARSDIALVPSIKILVLSNFAIGFLINKFYFGS